MSLDRSKVKVFPAKRSAVTSSNKPGVNCNQVTTQKQTTVTDRPNYWRVQIKLDLKKLQPGLGTLYAMRLGKRSGLLYSSHGLHMRSGL